MVALLMTQLIGCSREFAIAPVEQPEPWENADVFDQTSAARSDVLFVVDNSQSMAEEQELLAVNFPVFLEWFERFDVDYHIGVVSTDMEDPRQSGLLQESQGVLWIERSTPDPAAVLAEMTLLGATGSNEERGRDAAYTALELRGAANAGFRRDDAFLNVVAVSDEDDQSDDTRISQSDFVRYLLDLRSDTTRTTFSAIVGPRSYGEAQRCHATPGIDYLEVVQAVGGVGWSICDVDWSPLVDELGFVSIGLRREFRLSYTPDPDTIAVVVDEEEEPPDAWRYDPEPNAVTFTSDPPPSGSRVIVRYTTYDEP